MGRPTGAPRSLEEASASIVGSDAEDEDPFRLQEALPQDREGQAARQARVLEPHPREEVARAEAALQAAFEDLEGGSRAGEHAAGWGWSLMPRATNAVARKK